MIKEIINNLKELSLSHMMIKSFEKGDSFTIQKTGETLYPSVFLEYPFNIVYTKGSKTITFAYYIIDLPSEGYQDDVELMDKVEQINDDLLMRMELLDYDWFHQVTNSNSITLTEWEGDNTIAIRTDITLTVDRDYNNCEAPFKSILTEENV